MPPIAKLKSLATTNLAVLCLRLVQFFFAGVEVGIMGYYIKLQLSNGDKASSPYIFVLVVGVFTMLTQFIYCFNYYHRMTFLWDAAVATGWLLSFFWLLNYVSPLACGWSSFNPFGSDKCGQTRSVLTMEIILAVLWFFTAFLGLLDLFKARRKAKALGDV
ncbi:hypothetical protein TRVA0_021S01244 [Trichomonascus vanleenenianus]|uniref:uncharacterized protein n=1 Tax=Trichomonascus vanleenenianus TaxID=2268995 RepID=UPI003ECB53C1